VSAVRPCAESNEREKKSQVYGWNLKRPTENRRGEKNGLGECRVWDPRVLTNPSAGVKDETYGKRGDGRVGNNGVAKGFQKWGGMGLFRVI